jgi:hypothetical protein
MKTHVFAIISILLILFINSKKILKLNPVCGQPDPCPNGLALPPTCLPRCRAPCAAELAFCQKWWAENPHAVWVAKEQFNAWTQKSSKKI